jgi:23S rRNA (cytosine1962-C5)-methyltransferase
MKIPNTTAYRLVNDAGSGRPGVVVDHLGPAILIQSQHAPESAEVDSLARQFPDCSIYYKSTTRHVRQLDKSGASPQLIHGPQITGRFPITENGLTFLLSLESGYSTGLFLDQRDNRRSILEMNLHGKTVLNTFAYTCAFSVCAAKAGAIVTSLDLSKNYLDWGRDNFRANNIDDTAHDFIFGDVLEWLPRLAKKGRRWDLIILDPPTFSTGKSGKSFQALRDYPKLLAMTQACLAPGGQILACMNTHEVSVAEFKQITGVKSILPLPRDFPVAEGAEPHLKSGWIEAKISA